MKHAFSSRSIITTTIITITTPTAAHTSSCRIGATIIIIIIIIITTTTTATTDAVRLSGSCKQNCVVPAKQSAEPGPITTGLRCLGESFARAAYG